MIERVEEAVEHLTKLAASYRRIGEDQRADYIGIVLSALAERTAETERLNAALRYEENRSGRIGTHGPGCHEWGPRHYECLVEVLAERTKALDEIARIRTELRGDFSLSSRQSKIARQALTSGDQT